MPRRAAALLVLLTACAGGADEPGPTQDIKIDGYDKEEAVESVRPRTCFADGRLYAVWQDEREGAPTAVRVNVSADSGATWLREPVRLDQGALGASAPDIACADGNVYVVWEDVRDGELLYPNIYVNVSNDGGRTWLAEDVALDADPDGKSTSLAPRVAAAGDAAYVTWFDNRDGAYDIYVQATADAGASWLTEPTRVDTDDVGSAYSAWPRVVADDAGRVVVAWEDSRAGGSDIYANASTDGGRTFGEDDARLDRGDDGGASNSFLPQIALAGDHVYVVWHDERNGDNRDIFLNNSSDGGASWLDEPRRVDSDAEGQSDAINPVVAAAGDRVHVVWQDDRSGGYDIRHRVSRDGGETWGGEEVRMDTDAGGESQSYAPVLTVRDDVVLVGWQDRRADAENVGFDDLYYNYSQDGGQNWGASDLRINSNKTGSAYAIDLSLQVVGSSFAAVWADGRFGTSDIFAATRELGEESVYVPPEE